MQMHARNSPTEATVGKEGPGGEFRPTDARQGART